MNLLQNNGVHLLSEKEGGLTFEQISIGKSLIKTNILLRVA